MSDSLREFEHLRGHGVMILTPVYRETCWQYSQSLLKTIFAFQQLGIRFGIEQVVGNSRLPVARNKLAAAFLASGAPDALFIDADMEWQPSDALRLLSSSQLLIGAPCRRRRDDLPVDDIRSWCVNLLPENARRDEPDPAGAIEVEATGTGFLRVDREVFERLIEAHPEWKRPAPEGLSAEKHRWYYRFFGFPEDADVGEDYLFCRDWRALEGSVWVHPQTSVGHVGEFVYRGSFAPFVSRAGDCDADSRTERKPAAAPLSP